MKKFGIVFVTLVLALVVSGCGYLGPGNADFNYKLPGKYELVHSPVTAIWSNTGVGKAVEEEVIGIAWNDNFILAEQKANNNSNYWIIDVKTDKKYGPMDTKNFESKKNELKIDTKLILETPEKYKYLDQASQNNK